MHGDPGPGNAVFSFGYPVALIGWTGCRPGPRLADLAAMAWTWCIQPDAGLPVPDQAAHLRELASGYESGQPLVAPADLLRAILRGQEELIEAETARDRDPARPPRGRERAGRTLAWASACYDLTLASSRQFLAALGG
jgi:aminoglycoside phosphotransferase (APT) family kinase protein